MILTLTLPLTLSLTLSVTLSLTKLRYDHFLISSVIFDHLIAQHINK